MKRRISVLTGFFLIFFQVTSFGNLTLQDLRLPKDFFPAPSSNTTVPSVQENPQAPGFLTFSITSPYGSDKVHGLANLRKYLHEIDVLNQLETENEGTSGGVAAGAADSIKDTGKGLKNLVVHPADSAKGVGQATKKLGGKITGIFRKKEEGEKGDSFLSGTKREIAKKLGVDVYSRNQALQDKLDAMAKSRMGGRGIVAVATFFVPVGLIVSAVMTASSINSAADELVNDKDRGDLYRLNEKALMDMSFPKEKVVRFLNHPYYTPRELTYLRFYLEALQKVKGFEAILDAAIASDSEISADKILHETQIAADFVTKDPGVVKMTLIPQGLALEKQNVVILVTAYDYLDASPFGKGIVEKALSLKKTLGKNSVELWNGGVVTSGLGGQLLLTGVKIHRLCLFSSTSPEAEI